MSLVGRQFPNVTIDAISEMGDNLRINILDEAIKNQQKVLLFWYPKDFTFVCPTELHAFQDALEEFKKRNTIVIGASCDTNEVHFAWLNTPKDNGGIEGVTYPILADTHRHLSNLLGIVDQDIDFDDEGNEIYTFLRLIDAYTHVQKHGEVCPANWEEGKDAMKADRTSTAEYLAKH